MWQFLKAEIGYNFGVIFLTQIAILRSLPVLIIHGLLSVLYLFHIVAESDPIMTERLWSRFTMVGGIFTNGILAGLIISDLKQLGKERFRALFVMLMIGYVIVSAGLFLALKFVLPKQSVPYFIYFVIHSPVGIGFAYAFGLGLFFLAIKTYKNKTSYLG
ncbi:hypothetical protein MJD09_26305 [bacterium]|nr:hypothetical protein [bacterium]